MIYLFVCLFIFKEKGVGAVCTNSTDCGDEMDCVGDRCVCNEGSELAETTDSEGRPVQYCTNGK